MFIDIIFIAIALIAGLGLLVLVHEWGHFAVARWAGVRIEAFSIGFGPTIAAFRRGETEYKISLLPLGGYVKMAGEDPNDEATRSDPRAYCNMPVWKKMAIVLAGPTMNILLCSLIMPLPFFIGRERPAYEAEMPIVAEIERGTSAALAGLQPGDRIVAIAGHDVATWEVAQEQLLLAGNSPLALRVERNNTVRDVTLTPTCLGFGVHPAARFMNRPIADQVQPGGSAVTAGLQAGDEIIGLEGERIHTWDELTLLLGAHDSAWCWMQEVVAWGGHFDRVSTALAQPSPVAVQIRRGDAVQTLALRPTLDKNSGRYLLGIQHDPEKIYQDVPKILRRYGVTDSIVMGERDMWRLVKVTGQFLQSLVSKPAQHYKSLGGPVRIITMFAKIAQEGLAPFLYFLSFFSLQLGMLNLLPIPVLDGGHVVFLALEAVRGKPLSLRAQTILQNIGFTILLSLIIFVTINDLGSFAWVQRLIGK